MSLMSVNYPQLDSLQNLSESYEGEITDLSNQLYIAMQNQDDGVYQAM